jgi:hypothetical protein
VATIRAIVTEGEAQGGVVTKEEEWLLSGAMTGSRVLMSRRHGRERLSR